MRVFFLLCGVFTLSAATGERSSATTADPVKEVNPEPSVAPVPVQENKTKEGKLGELLLPWIAGRMPKWQDAGITKKGWAESHEVKESDKVYRVLNVMLEAVHWGKLAELLPWIADRMPQWQHAGVTPPLYYYDRVNSCPSSWRSYESRCFIFINSPMAWIDAEKHCWLYGANLASIHDQSEHQFIRDSVIEGRYHGQAWIGGNDAVRSSEWLWSDGSVFDLTSWASQEPVSTDRWKKCLRIGRPDYHILNNWYCEDRLPFVCGTRPGGLA